MFHIPSFEEIRASILRDTQSLDPTADISNDSDHYVHASRLASVAVGQYAHQAWIVRQIFPDTADSEYLERHASLRGLRRKQAVTATGTVTAYGLDGSKIAAGLALQANNQTYLTTAGAVITKGQAQIPVAAMESGSIGNAQRVAAKWFAPPAGVQSEAVLTATGGVEAESDAALLARLLEIIRRPPAGGNRYDYRNWALSVEGVTQAFVYPLRRGLGTVDIAITAGDELPSDDTVRAVQAYIDEQRPVTAKNALVIKPTITRVNVTAQVRLDGVDLEIAKARIQTALADYFSTLAPGDDVVVSQLEAVISDTAGVLDRVMSQPVRNLTADIRSKIEWFKLGTVNITRISV